MTWIKNFDHENAKKEIEKLFQQMIDALKLKQIIPVEHINETPKRLSKMFIEELFDGCYSSPPELKIFTDEKSTPVINSNISIKSICAHHFIPFYGKATIYYTPAENRITGLSKFSRIADYFSRRPQIQEILTRQIGEYLFDALQPIEIIVAIKAKHMCICHRGANEDNPITETFWTKSKYHDMIIPFEKIKYILETIKYSGE